ncbi:MAG: AIR synthase related protein [Bacteroides sp.]|nr:AIR synthase related protein [Bacteroides sp.]MCM1413515.1 AIR synthase related protein [Bacteroides sp.]MCM1471069.1 AIR synthase related protein [Bacteroides sp.]
MNNSTHLDPFLRRAPEMSSVIPHIDADLSATTVHVTDTPIVFGEANIGRAAVNIAANRLLAMGSKPRYICASLTIDTDTDVRLVNVMSAGMQDAALQSEMEWSCVTTHFTDRGPIDGIDMSLFALGEMSADYDPNPRCGKPGDVLIVTCPVGDFGTAVAATKRNIMPMFIGDGVSMLDPINQLMRVVPRVHYMALLDEGLEQHIDRMREYCDPVIDKDTVPVSEVVSTTCQLLDRNPLRMACTSSILIAVSKADATKALDALHRSPLAAGATIVGRIG